MAGNQRGISRREVMKGSGAAIALGVLPQVGHAEVGSLPGLAGLTKRTGPEVYSGEELKFIGMPIGGFFAGTVYLGGDGQLWNWDIFNQEHFGCVEREPTVFMGERLDAGGGANYVDPVKQQSPFHQAFELRVVDGKPRRVRFGDIRFRGEYPIGKVTYREGDADVEMSLEAFSPFCPQDVDNSSFPATTLTFRITNTGVSPQEFQLVYEFENPVLHYSKGRRSDIELRGAASDTHGVRFGAAAKPHSTLVRQEIVFADWSDGTYGSWKVTGTAFGSGPRRVSEMPSYMGDLHAGTVYIVNSHETRHGEDVVRGDAHVGTLTSPEFKIERKYINLRVGGGSHKGGTCVNLLVDGQVVRSVTGHDNNAMQWESMPVGDLGGKTAQLQVVDQVTGAWGNIGLGEVIFSDQPKEYVALTGLPDYGSFAIEFVGGADAVEASSEKATVTKSVQLAAGAHTELTLVVAWHFANCGPNLPGKRNWYATRWRDASDVVSDLVARWPRLQGNTRAWNKTWYDSTLPHWFLDRTFLNTSILASKTCKRLDEGRFYFWEGASCCAGTCTHVWGYAQAIGRLFPEIERYLRTEIDFGRAYHKDTGAIDYRCEYGQQVATDGQASCILRAYREHLMSQDDGFLKGIWPQVKGAMQLLIRQDPNHSGILDGAQYNTLDTAWYGEIAWISSLYIAALRASEAMAMRMGDTEFATECGKLASSGSKRMVQDLFNGEYFVNKVDSSHPEANNTNVGCHIDQLYGQSWALQVGLPRIVPEANAKTALKSLFKYSFYEDVWEYRRKNKAIPGGRWYATPKEAGLIMCSFPKGGAAQSVGQGGDAWAVGYFNECMTGFEYQVANHMIAEGMLEEGLKVVYAIHQRYQPSKRNPYNEIECSDHYGRAMAAYGSFVSIAGMEIDGPAHRLSIKPKLSGHFRCAFVNEQGWGTVDRAADGKTQVNYAFRLDAQR